MRQLFALWVVLLGCGFTSAQDACIYPGQYAQPSAPRVFTPIASPGTLRTPWLTLDIPLLTVGANDSTLENATGSPVYFNQPLRYEPGVSYNPHGSGLVGLFGTNQPCVLQRTTRN